jgi:hypothetical protein
MSENNAEYQRNKRLIESKHLSLNFFNDALYEKAEERLLENDKAGKWEQKRFIAVIDGSEIRKKHSSDSEYLQKVRSLDGELVNGYRSTGTVLLIKKIIALTFFAAAWFYFTKKEVLENPVLEKRIYHLCQLGRGKKQIGPLYLQQGLESLMSHFLVSKWQKEYEISDQE